jgi:hypothetical protein
VGDEARGARRIDRSQGRLHRRKVIAHAPPIEVGGARRGTVSRQVDGVAVKPLGGEEIHEGLPAPGPVPRTVEEEKRRHVLRTHGLAHRENDLSLG